jgi:hypothetical protein
MANYEALHQLRRVVSAAPEELFHMRACVERAACGTARCAFGWCIVDPWFRENTEVGQIPIDFGVDKEQVGFRFPKGTKPHSVFDLDITEASVLFACSNIFHINDIGEHEITRKEVLDNIDRLLRGEEPEEYAVFRS